MAREPRVVNNLNDLRRWLDAQGGGIEYDNYWVEYQPHMWNMRTRQFAIYPRYPYTLTPIASCNTTRDVLMAIREHREKQRSG